MNQIDLAAIILQAETGVVTYLNSSDNAERIKVYRPS